ncbi:MAG TPA: metallophosphoesterase [Pyrinomonadaceae bacterium]|nr:metallophosphoesterase [Pyrinomonadaceae bacterium]
MNKFLKVFIYVILGGMLCGLSCGIYAYFIEPRRFVINEQTLAVSDWKKEQDGFKIVAISDIHGGAHYMDEARIRYLVEQSNAQNPDIVVLLGDFVSEVNGVGSPLIMPVSVIADNLKGLKSNFGVYAVIGNHDWWHDEKEITRELERVGYKVLENESASFKKNGQNITIIGIEDFWKRRRVDIASVFSKIERKENILAITHNPDSFDQIPEGISLLLAGHTHGGQVVIPFFGPPIVVAKREYTKGFIQKENKSLFVTTGVSAMIRFGVPPEIAVLTINSK